MAMTVDALPAMQNSTQEDIAKSMKKEEPSLTVITNEALTQTDDEALSQEFQMAACTQTTAYKTQQQFKRLFDVVSAGLGIIALSPMLLLVAALVKITSPGPVFYKSLRVGKNHQFFYMYKFRTMVNGADKLREKMRAEAQQEGELFKIKNDTRITPLGEFLRKYSLDEFPQLLNVMKGEMSLVGPRPFSPDNCKLFEAPYTLRFKALPGMTGKWQVSGRSNLTFKQACELDLNYVVRWNIVEDFNILLQTIPTVLFKKGAY